VNRRALVSSLGALLLSAGAAIGVSRLAARKKPPSADGLRLVTLSPALTETVLALGGSSVLVGVSNYCKLPASLPLPRVGSSLTPNYEAITRLRPSHILSDDSAASKGRELSALAPCEILPWLTLEEVVSSTRRIGKLLGQEPAGNALAARLLEGLSRKPPPDAPRALLLLSYDPDRPADIWFIRPNSLHGAALAAAGARNAVAEDVTGLPRLGVEELIALDPDVVLITPPPGASLEQRQRCLEGFSRLAPLRAVKNGRVAIVPGATQSVGPSILDLVTALSTALTKLAGPHPPTGLVE
jgi:ABC-type Fe3+-hydroxamate transport system substrate-binding protein